MTTVAAFLTDLRGIRAGKPGAHEGSCDFPFDWERPDDRELTWKLDGVHWPGALAPLVFEAAGEPVAEALMSAASTYEMLIAEVRIQQINGYRYQSTVPLICDPVVEARHRRSEVRLRAAIGVLGERWTDTWLPLVKAHLEYWGSFRLPEASLPALPWGLPGPLRRAGPRPRPRTTFVGRGSLSRHRAPQGPGQSG